MFVEREKRIYYEVHGKGKPLIFLHGLGLNGTTFRKTVNTLPGYRAVIIDLMGHGRSDKPKSWTLPQHLADIEAVMKQEKIKKASFVGHSMGSFLALHFAAKHPERVKKLLLINEVHTLNVMTLTLPFLIIGLLYFKFFNWLVRLHHHHHHYVDFSKHVKDSLFTITYLGQISSYRSAITSGVAMMRTKPVPLKKIMCKTIILNGVFDEIMSQYSDWEIHRKVKNSIVLTEPADHFLPIKKPNMVRRVIQTYL